MLALNTQKIFVALITTALLLSFAQFADARPSNKWRIHYNGKAETDGVVTLKFTTEKGESSLVEIAIDKGTHENQAARQTRSQLRDQLGEYYRIAKDDGEEVKVRAERGEDNFEIKEVSNTAKGLHVRMDRE
jgi:hypothetical protein